MTITEALKGYILSHDLKPGSEDFYRRAVGVYRTWAGRDVQDCEFTVGELNRFLRDKQQAGRSSYYVRSLRAALRALLRYLHGACEGLRPVRCKELLSDTWDADQVGILAAAAKSDSMRLLILFAYYTGLSECDLRRMKREDISPQGVIHFFRQKTYKRVIVAVPVEILTELPQSGLLFPKTVSDEWFRRTFKEVVKRAGLCGTFKKLRRSSGTAIELMHPGRGHLHLGNSREIFERHYLDKARDSKPFMPPPPGRPAA